MHATSALLLSVLLHFSPAFLIFSPAAVPSSSSARVLLSLPPLPTSLFSAPPLLLPANPVHGVAHVDQARRGHEHNLQHLKQKDGTSSTREASVSSRLQRGRQARRLYALWRWRAFIYLPSIVYVRLGRLGHNKRSRSPAVLCHSWNLPVRLPTRTRRRSRAREYGR